VRKLGDEGDPAEFGTFPPGVTILDGTDPEPIPIPILPGLAFPALEGVVKPSRLSSTRSLLLYSQSPDIRHIPLALPARLHPHPTRSLWRLPSLHTPAHRFRLLFPLDFLAQFLERVQRQDRQLGSKAGGAGEEERFELVEQRGGR
jgi:hypothetical protein